MAPIPQGISQRAEREAAHQVTGVFFGDKQGLAEGASNHDLSHYQDQAAAKHDTRQHAPPGREAIDPSNQAFHK
jgi:hypothetical protein